MYSSSHLITIAPAFLLSLLVLTYIRSAVGWRSRTRGRSLPPGPAPLPLLGNVFNIPKYKPWITYHELSAKYGPILYFRALGQSIVVLDTPEVIFELLDKRSANTSDRRITAAFELAGLDTNFGFQAYGPRWRHHRRAFWQQFTQNAILRYQQAQRVMAHKFLFKLLQDPARLKEHIRYSFSATLMKILYNIEVADEGDPYLTMVEQGAEAVSEGIAPGKFFVEYLPFLKHVPAWVPGAGFQTKFAGWRAAAESLRTQPFNHMKRSMENEATSSVTGRIASNDSGEFSQEEKDEIAKNVGLVAFEAGSDTTFSLTQSAFLALSVFPEVLQKAQAELDAVVGADRMPEFSDFESLVYLHALVKEVMRWHNVVPLGLPHGTIDDDELQGYFIPRGTMVLANIWACMHDPAVYENPDEFNPDRFIKDGRIDANLRDPAQYIFGFGRRICPGRHFAETALLLNLASVIHVFQITPPLDEEGRPIKIIPRATDGLLSYPEDCRCTIKPRSLHAEAMIRACAGGTVLSSSV